MQRSITPIFAVCAAWLALSLPGCAVTGPAPTAHESAGGDYAQCGRFFHSLQQAIKEEQIYDNQAAPIDGYPYLRVNRFLASFRHRTMDDAMIRMWLERLMALGAEAWRVELANLPARRRASLARQTPHGLALERAAGRCAATMRTVDLATSRDLARLRRRASVPDDYHTAWRILGLYPVTGLLVSFGTAKLHREIRRTFSQPRDKLPVAGKLTRYTPPGRVKLTPRQVAHLLTRISNNPLGIPEPDAAQRERLFDAFAPVWEVDTAGGDDRIGTPRRDAGARNHVDTAVPTVYRLLSHGWWGGHPVLQLNYIIWFPARPATGILDPYAGHLDGITLRVTLGRDGRPLFYDGMHNCGCYHMFFPRRGFEAKLADVGLYAEPPRAPQSIPILRPGQRLVVRIAHRTHYLQRLYGDAPSSNATPYTFADYNTLRSLPVSGGGHRSLFAPDGLVPHTRRAERWWLWPMGVAAPGAMRQWGHHAIAFLGRRHFDDADLFSSLFTVTSP